MDEAMHDLTLMGTGAYGEYLEVQNGAPIRLVVPWKYGFKSIKSIVEIELTSTRPKSLWNMAIPSEYGFYANVNPLVNHPRWSQKYEKPVGSSIFAGKKKTLMFNGYNEVADIYKGMDLRVNY